MSVISGVNLLAKIIHYYLLHFGWVGGGCPKDLVLGFKKKYSPYLRHRTMCDLVFYYILQVSEIKNSKRIR